MSKRPSLSSLSLLAVSLLLPTSMTAERGKVWFGFRATSGVDVSFSDVGDVPFVTEEDADNPFVFDNGFINVENTGAQITSDYAFEFANVIENDEGLVSGFELERFASVAEGAVVANDVKTIGGWEVGYYKRLLNIGNHTTLRFNTGFAASLLDTSGLEVVEGQFFMQTATVTLSNPSIEFQDEGSYIGGEDGPILDLETDLDFDPNSSQQVTQQLANGDVVTVPSEVEFDYDVNGGIAEFRLGGHIETRLFKKLSAQVGGGAIATYVSADFDISQSIVNTTLGSPKTLEEDTFTQKSWLTGYYAEAGIYYNVNENVRAFAGWQQTKVDSLDSFTISNITTEVDLQNTSSIRFGFIFDY